MQYLVMEYVEGLDLSALLRRTGPLDVADACEIARQAAIGLQEAHENGMVHRDIKPSNLMLTSVGHGNQPPVLKIPRRSAGGARPHRRPHAGQATRRSFRHPRPSRRSPGALGERGRSCQLAGACQSCRAYRDRRPILRPDTRAPDRRLEGNQAKRRTLAVIASGRATADRSTNNRRLAK